MTSTSKIAVMTFKLSSVVMMAFKLFSIMMTTLTVVKHIAHALFEQILYVDFMHKN